MLIFKINFINLVNDRVYVHIQISFYQVAWTRASITQILFVKAMRLELEDLKLILPHISQKFRIVRWKFCWSFLFKWNCVWDLKIISQSQNVSRLDILAEVINKDHVFISIRSHVKSSTYAHLIPISQIRNCGLPVIICLWFLFIN